jgi:hypothetical protein
MAVPVHTSGGFTFGNPTKLFDARSHYFAPPNAPTTSRTTVSDSS